jgi:hypothetical protein
MVYNNDMRYIALFTSLLSSCSYMTFEQRAGLSDIITYITNTVLGTRPQDRALHTSYSFTIEGKNYYPDDSGYVVFPPVYYTDK